MVGIKEVKIIIDGTEKKVFNGHISDIDETFDLSNGQHTIRVEARNEKENSGSSEVKISVKEDYKE